MSLIYFDNNATTQPDPAVVDAMLPYLREWYGNPSSVHRFGQRSRQAIDIARGQVAALVHCAESEITFTGGGTEAVNTQIRALLAARSPRRKVVTSAVEHSATRELAHQLRRDGVEVVELPVDQLGRLEARAVETALDDATALVTLLWANNETGVLFPVSEIAVACRARKIPFHVDATQAVGKIPVDVRASGIDAASFASHKFHGPKGVGAMFTRRGMRLRPMIVGGPQEHGRRGGTENVPGIVGMGVAAELASQSLSQSAEIARRRDRLEQGILQGIPDSRVNGCVAHRLPNTTNIGFYRLEAEAILLLLSEQDVCASAGAACSSGSLEPSHVLQAMGVEERLAHGAIRFSLSRYTTDAEVDQVLHVLPPLIKRLSAVLPVSG